MQAAIAIVIWALGIWFSFKEIVAHGARSFDLKSHFESRTERRLARRIRGAMSSACYRVVIVLLSRCYCVVIVLLSCCYCVVMLVDRRASRSSVVPQDGHKTHFVLCSLFLLRKVSRSSGCLSLGFRVPWLLFHMEHTFLSSPPASPLPSPSRNQCRAERRNKTAI